ncbi:hypothetical protein MRX96_032415 [Rhipicephalus microplus]
MISCARLECALQPTLPALWPHGHQLAAWISVRHFLTAAAFPGARQTLIVLSGLGDTPPMGHSNPIDFFAMQFLVLPWILMLLQNFDQPTGFPLFSGASHLPVNASPRNSHKCEPCLDKVRVIGRSRDTAVREWVEAFRI